MAGATRSVDSMSDTFSVTAAVTPANPSSGQTVTVTISGNDVLTEPGTISGTLHLIAADGATSDLSFSAPYSQVSAQSVRIASVTDPSGRAWTVAANGLTATAIA